MKTSYIYLLLLYSFALVSTIQAQDKVTQSFKAASNKEGFIENKGQIIDQNNNLNPDVKFLFNQAGLNVQLKKNSFSYDAYVVERNSPPVPADDEFRSRRTKCEAAPC